MVNFFSLDKLQNCSKNFEFFSNNRKEGTTKISQVLRSSDNIGIATVNTSARLLLSYETYCLF